MDFPLIDLLDQAACHERLVGLLHPDGLACPRCGARDGLGIHRRHRGALVDYRCGVCGRVFNAYAGTPLRRSRRTPAELILILRGIAQGVPTARLARELGRDRKHLPELRHRLQGAGQLDLDRNPPGDPVAEADECYVNAGGKRDPPRRPG